jgi:serine/threonine protein phosphatase PrpC
MEDAKIHKIGLPGSISVFGVFDGHGGTEIAIQASRWPSLLRNTLSPPCWKTPATNVKTTPTPSSRPSRNWMR